jgi:3'(2'), 5'-bisphosphate nucleotidase
MHKTIADFDFTLEELITVTKKAGAVIMDIYASEFTARTKHDASPVTIADEMAERLIVDALALLTPLIPIVAEEAIAAGHAVAVGETFWLVDPLDGTKEFVSRNGEFTVNIALVSAGAPIAGVVYAPAIDRLFAGALGKGAFVEEQGKRRPIQVREVPEEGWSIVSSRSHGDETALAEFLGKRKIAELKNAGSSLKICLVAAGEADMYPRLGRTMEWDIAAGDAVVRAAGGCLQTLEGQPMRYGKPEFENPHFVVIGNSDNNLH